MSPIEHRIQRFQELINKGFYYRLMNFNLYILKRCIKNGKWIRIQEYQLNNLEEDFVWF